jgi:two-component system cell cycle sensor histidine kinase/response regulator CckA
MSESSDAPSRESAREEILGLGPRGGPKSHYPQLRRQIEELERARVELRESRERFRAMVETTTDWIWEVDPEGRYTYSSPAVRELLGYEPEDVVGKTCFDLMAKRDVERVRTAFQASAGAGRPFQGLVNTNLHRDGSEVILETSAVPIFDGDGMLLGYRGIDRNITDRIEALEALRESETTLRTLLQAAPVAVGLVTERVLGWTNERMTALIGYAPDELMGQGARILYDSDEEYERVGRVKHPQVEARGVGSVETRFRRKDGSVVDVLLSSAAIDPKDMSKGLVFTAMDISDRARADRTLRENEERFRLLYENSPLAYQALDEGGACQEVNQAWLHLLGYRRSEVLGEPFSSFLTGESAARFDEELATFRVEGALRNLELEIIPRSGEVRTVSLDGKVVRARMRGVTQLHCILHDITERRRAETEIAKLQGLLRAAIEQSPAGILVADAPDARIRLANSAALGIRCGEPDELLDIPSDQHPARWQVFRSDGKTPCTPEELPLTRAITDGERCDNETFMIRRPDGEERWVLANAAPVRNEDGEVVAGVVVFPDITDLRRAQEDLLRTQEQLRQSQKMEAIGQLAGGVAHDFNNQLTVIGGYSELLLQRLAEDDPMRLPLQEIRRAGERAKQLTAQLLAFGRKQVLKPETLDLGEVLDQMSGPLRRMVGEQIHIELLPCPRLARVRLDRSQFEQAVMNLVVNARHAMPDGGTLLVETSTVTLGKEFLRGEPQALPGAFVRVRIQDTGCGMDAKILAKIFDPFFTTKPVGEGTGLGLAMVHGFVGQSRGVITVDSEVGIGSDFRLFFPVAEAEERSREREPRAEVRGGSETVLVTEDEEAVRDLIVNVLQRRGYRVLSCAAPEEALEIGRERRDELDLLVTDVIMPRMTGPQLTERLREEGVDLPVLYVSGYAPEKLGPLSEKELVQKPFLPDVLAETVRRVLDEATGGS